MHGLPLVCLVPEQHSAAAASWIWIVGCHHTRRMQSVVILAKSDDVFAFPGAIPDSDSLGTRGRQRVFMLSRQV